jgi:hypothetical protein
VLAYGGPFDCLDEYLHMGQSMILETVNHFTKVIMTYMAPRILGNQLLVMLLGYFKKQRHVDSLAC